MCCCIECPFMEMLWPLMGGQNSRAETIDMLGPCDRC